MQNKAGPGEAGGAGISLDSGCGLVLLFIVAGVISVGYRAFASSWPISGMLLGALLLLFVTWRRAEKDLVSRSVATVLIPVTAGLALLTITLVVLNARRPSLSPATVRTVEDFLIALNAAVGSVTTFRFGPSMAVLAGALLVAELLPRVRAVSIWVKVNAWVSATALLLAVLTSFTLFSQIPVHVWAMNRYEEMKDRYELSLQSEEVNAVRLLAAQMILVPPSSLECRALSPAPRRAESPSLQRGRVTGRRSCRSGGGARRRAPV